MSGTLFLVNIVTYTSVIIINFNNISKLVFTSSNVLSEPETGKFHIDWLTTQKVLTKIRQNT